MLELLEVKDNYRLIVGLLVLLFLNTTLLGQSSYITGRVIDVSSNEAIIDAMIFNLSNGSIVFSNEDGYYSCKGDVGDSLAVSALGYSQDTLICDQNSFIVILKGLLQEAITIYGSRSKIQKLNVNKLILTQASIKNQALLAGESDPIRALHYTSGVTNTREGQSGLVVRGGLPDQNLILLDGVRIYNYTHLFGFLSFINGNIVNDMTFYKSGIPAEYGGRSSSVVDINILDGNISKRHGNVSIGLLTSKLYYNFPIINNKMTISGALRLSYFDFVSVFQSDKKEDRDTEIGVGDGMLKLYYKPSDNSHFTLTYITTRDKHLITSQIRKGYSLNGFDESGRKWKNDLVSLNYGTPIFSNSYLNIDAGYYGYIFKYSKSKSLKKEGITYLSKSNSVIKEYSAGLSIESDVYNTDLKYGLKVNNTVISPFKYLHKGSIDSIDNEINSQHSTDLALYSQFNKTVGNWSIDGGLRASLIYLNSNYSVHLFPRAKVSYHFDKWSTGLGYDRNYQTIYQTYPIALGTPIEIWLTNDKISISNQVSIFIDLEVNKKISLSSSVYYKNINKLNEIGKVFQDFDEKLLNIEQVVIGDGNLVSMGVDFEISHNTKKIKQNLSVGIQKSSTKFSQLNDGNSFPTNFSRYGTFSYNMQLVLGKGWNVGITAVVQSGQPITLPVNSYFAQYGAQRFIFKDRNNARYPVYYRLDFLIQKEFSKKSSFIISLYNVTNKKNPFHIVLESNTDGGGFQYSHYQDEVLFGILPTIAYEYKF